MNMYSSSSLWFIMDQLICDNFVCAMEYEHFVAFANICFKMRFLIESLPQEAVTAYRPRKM